MEIKQPPPKAMVSAAGLGGADNQISLLSQKVLPSIPHLFSVPTKTPYQPTFAHENLNTPFEQREVMALQYMTLISSGDRGVGHTAANWQDDMNASPPPSAGAHSSSGTPNAVRDPKKPAVKMSIADYKNMKTTGLKPPPGAPTATSESKRGSDATEYRPGHTRNTSSTSVDTPMARISSLEGDRRRNGADVPVKAERKAPIPTDRAGQPHPTSLEREGKPHAAVNGQSAREPSKDISSSKANAQPSNEAQKHLLPPRPQSPRRISESKQQKRPHDATDSAHPEKQVNGERGEARAPSNGQNSVPRKTEPHSSSKPSPSQKAAAPPRPLTSTPPKKAASVNAKHGESTTSATKSAEKPLKIPKILSPLPDDLIIPLESDQSSLKVPTSEKGTPHGGSSNGTSPDTIVVKTSRPRDSASSSSRPPPSKSSDGLPPFHLPRLLSPDLPDIVEAELLRLKEKASNSLNTVEARHEKVRQPGALGVAQKTQRPKVGHPPKKIRIETPKIKIQDDEIKSAIVKIRYKKRLAKQIQRILALPSKSIKKREVEDRIRERSGSAVPPAGDTSSSEDMPIAVRRSANAPAGTTGQKRPSALSDTKPPASKRLKSSEVADVAKTSTPVTPIFKSPAPAGSKERAPLVTPKKGDAMKSVTMRKVDSSEGHAHTPQSGNISAPASAEKSRISGLAPQVVSQELARASQEHSKFFPLGTTLKRKMDAILKNTDATENERKIGIMNGIEALLCYMLAFHASDKTSKFRNQAPQQENWAQFFPLWTFMEKKTPQYPELHALVEQLGAVSREQLNKASIEQPKEKRDWDKTVSNLKERDRLWLLCKRNEQLILSLGVTSTLGPWSSVSEAVGFGMATLTCYSEKQGGLEWKQDPNLSASYMRKFMGEGA